MIETLFGSAGQDMDSHRSLSSIGNIPEDYSLLSAVVCQDAWSFYAHSDKPAYLVFDDFHHVADNAAICEIVRYLISNMPPNIHIIVISRIQTGISKEKLRLSGELVCLDKSCLLFSKDEIEALFSNGGEICPAKKDYVGEIFSFTGGWIAGVMLMRHTLEHLNAMEIRSFDEDRQKVFSYLLGEVFADVDRELIRQAVLISLLDEFICEDLSGVFGIENPSETIARLERDNFYIQKTNTDPPSYRFHSLFRDALRHILTDEYAQSDINAFHIAAAKHFEKTNRYAAAVGHYLSGADEQSAVRVAAGQGFVCTDNGDMQAAAELIRGIPEHLIFGDATLLMILGVSLCGSETDRGFGYLIKSMEMAVKNKELNLAVSTQGFAISVCIQRNDFASIKDVVALVPVPQAIRANRQAWKMLIHSLYLKSATSYQVKMAKTLGRIIDKVDMKDQMELWQYSSLLSKSYLCGVVGNLGLADDLLRQLTSHPVALRNDRWKAFGLQLSGYLSNYMGKTDALMQYADTMSSLGLKYTDGFASCYGAHYTALAKYQARDLAGAVSAAGFAERLFVENNNLSMSIFVNILQLAWQAEQDPDGMYANRIEQQYAPFVAAGGSEGFQAAIKTIAGALYLREGCPAKAEELLMQAWKWTKSKQALQHMCGTAMHLWALNREKGDSRREVEYLKFFGETSAKEGYVYFREMNFASLVRTCARCVADNIAPKHMAAVIGKYFGSDAVGLLLKEPSAAAADPESFIRRFPASMASEPGKVSIKLFGAFEMTVDGNKINPELFKTRKISGILKYILASPGKTISREKLAAAFWPDSGGRAAQNSLRVALFELRKVLAALDMLSNSGKALIAEDGDGLYACRAEEVESDVSRFTAIHESLHSGNLRGREEIAALKEMTALYDGDYLEGVDTEDYAAERAYYMSAYVEASYKLAEYCVGKSDTGYAEGIILKHLKIDPFDEKMCGMLTDLYSKTGRASQAASFKKQFTQYFEKEMGVKPEI